MSYKHPNRFATITVGLLLGMISLQTACGDRESTGKQAKERSQNATLQQRHASSTHDEDQTAETKGQGEDPTQPARGEDQAESEAEGSIAPYREWISADSDEVQSIIQNMHQLKATSDSQPSVQMSDETKNESKKATSKTLDELIEDEFLAESERYPEKLSKKSAKHYAYCFSKALKAIDDLNPFALVEATNALLNYFVDWKHESKWMLADENSAVNRITNLPSVFIDLFLELYAATLNADPQAAASAAQSAVQRTMVAFGL